MRHDLGVFLTHYFLDHRESALSISLHLMKAIFALERYEFIITLSPLDKHFKEMLTHDECLLELSVPSGLEVRSHVYGRIWPFKY